MYNQDDNMNCSHMRERLKEHAIAAGVSHKEHPHTHRQGNNPEFKQHMHLYTTHYQTRYSNIPEH